MMADIKLKAYPNGTGNWSDGSIWIGEVAPGAGDVAFINDNDNVVTLTGDMTVQYVTRDSGYGMVKFAGGHTLTTTSGAGGYAWDKVKVSTGTGGGLLRVTWSSDGEFVVRFQPPVDINLGFDHALDIGPATDDGSHRIDYVGTGALVAAAPVVLNGLIVHGCSGRPWNAYYDRNWTLIKNSEFYDSGSYVFFGRSGMVRFEGEVYIHGLGSYGLHLTETGVEGCGIIFGKDRNGNADANTLDDFYPRHDGELHLKNIVCGSVVIDTAWQVPPRVIIDGLGFISPGHLCNDESTPWQEYRNWGGVGTSQKVSSSDSTRRITPNSDVSATKPFRLQLPSIPASGGEQISLNLVAQASAAAHECSLVLDPDNLYGAYAIQTKDCETSETTFSVSATLTAGDYEVLVPVEFRVREYNAGGSVDVKSASGTVDGHALVLDLALWDITVARVPSTPSISVENDETGTSATVTVSGGDADATHRIFYRADRAAGWTPGLTRTGNGEKQQTGLEARWYQFHVVPDNGILGYPSNVAAVPVAPATDLETGTEFEDEYQAAAREPMLEVFGTEVLYRFADSSTARIKAMLTEEELSPRPTDQGRTLSVKVQVLVFKTDVPTVTRNADEIDVPGAWVNEDTIQTLRVATVKDTRAGTWLLGLT